MAYGFEFYAPTRVVFGRGTEKRTGELVKACGGTKALVVYGGKSAERSGLLGRVRESLTEAGVSFCELGGVVPNPHLSLVYKGIELCKAEGVDFLLAVGGGSAIDTAKAIGYGLANEGDVWDFYAKKRAPKACFPVGVVLTIAAAGSEMSNSSVITDERTGQKRGCNTDFSRPKFAIMNPELTLTLPDYQTMAGCADMMMHTMERYFTNGGNMEITDAIAEGLLRTVMRNANILHRDPQNYDARAEVMWASSLAHNNLTGCGNDGGDFASHMIEHELGGLYDVTHGAGLTAIWGSWARYVVDSCLPRFRKFAVRVMGVPEGGTDKEIALAGIAAMEDFYRGIGMPVSLKELGVAPTESEMRMMAEAAAKARGGKLGSAKKLEPEDIYRIYVAAQG